MNEQESLYAAIHQPVHLENYDPRWPAMFRAEHDRLVAALPGVFLELQHIGSTAVPGLAAKPIIDLLGGVESMNFARSLADVICQHGYATSEEFNAGLTDRQWFMRHTDGRRTHHLHLVVHGDVVWHEHLRFRDALRADASLARKYSELKRRLIQKHATDREAYTAAKNEFVRSVLEAN